MNNNGNNGNVLTLGAGVLIFAITVGAWLYAAGHDIPHGPLFYIAGPVISALLLAPSVSKAASAAEQAATQTNGGLADRVKAAVATALAERDAARTRQAAGDIGPVVPPPTTDAVTPPTP